MLTCIISCLVDNASFARCLWPRVLPFAGAMVAGLLGGGTTPIVDVFVALTAVFFSAHHRVAVLCSVVLYRLAFPPYCLPTVWAFLVPLLSLAESPPTAAAALLRFTRGFVAGSLSAWLTLGFTTAATTHSGSITLGLASGLLGLQWGFTVLFGRLSNESSWMHICIATATASICEAIQAYCGVVWPLTGIALPVAHSPLIALAASLGPFGVVPFVYATNAILSTTVMRPQQRRPMLASLFGLFAVAYTGGAIELSLREADSVPVDILLVQPQIFQGSEWETGELPQRLDLLTREALNDGNHVDLIVWPECVLRMSTLQEITQSHENTNASQPTDFYLLRRKMSPSYNCEMLVGILLEDEREVTRHGLPCVVKHYLNSACLLRRNGDAEHYDKTALIPFRERVPQFFGNCLPAVLLCDALRPNGMIELTPGNPFQIPFKVSSRGLACSVSASICYELFLPWLPQYSKGNGCQIVVHLCNDVELSKAGPFWKWQLWAAQLRAAESGKWQFICNAHSHSMIIDPKGRLRTELIHGRGTCQFHGRPLTPKVSRKLAL